MSIGGVSVLRIASFIALLEQQIEDCRETEENARTSDFANSVRGWIEEKLGKMTRGREEKIQSVESKLRHGSINLSIARSTNYRR